MVISDSVNACRPVELTRTNLQLGTNGGGGVLEHCPSDGRRLRLIQSVHLTRRQCECAKIRQLHIDSHCHIAYHYSMDDTPRYNLEQLAAAAGLSCRAVRFYIQRNLLPGPLGRGRGAHYGKIHRRRLAEIQRLQEAGHSLDAIAQILQGDAEPPAPAVKRRGRRRPARAVPAGLWAHYQLGDGIVLQVDTAKHQIDAAQLRKIQETIQSLLTDMPSR